MEIEIVIHTCLRDIKFTVNWTDVPELTENMLTEMHLRAWDEDHGDDEIIVVPDYFEDPDGHREALEKLEKLRKAKDGEGTKEVQIQIPSDNVKFVGITWGGLA